MLCAHCHRDLGSDDFYASNRTTCKTCVKMRSSAYRQANLEKVREYDRQRGQWAARKEYTKRNAHLYEKKRVEALKAHRKEAPEKYLARNAVNNAIRKGTLKAKPCERCGFAFGVQAHHEDYSKPLEVVWLCKPCHGQRHREINAERRRTG